MKTSAVLLPLCLIFSLPALAEPTLGRLFYTPAERAAMEARKSSRDAPEAAMPYQGLVLRGAGVVMVWQDDEAHTLPPDAGDAEMRRSVGGAQDELLRGGRIVVHPGK
ncbi:MAG: hypothetical protein LBJ59_11710 [Zoogloeaceae bacterium]|jgi:hypothetical protein|nr:hypothetical protein [Zoogloeaceae bacterium]